MWGVACEVERGSVRENRRDVIGKMEEKREAKKSLGINISSVRIMMIILGELG